MVVNVSSDAAMNPYANWGAYGASKAALHHLSRIWGEELAAEGIRVVSIDPGDMDTPMHALALPDADRSTLKRPDVAAREVADLIAAAQSVATPGHVAADARAAAAEASEGGSRLPDRSWCGRLSLHGHVPRHSEQA